MKHSKLNLVVLALVALSASSYAQSSGRGVGQRPDGRPNVDYRQDNSRSARSFDVVIRELENAIRKMRCALPVYQGRRSDALKDTMRILDQLREPDRSWPIRIGCYRQGSAGAETEKEGLGWGSTRKVSDEALELESLVSG